MKIAVTGASGLLGQELVQRLQANHDVVAFPRSKVLNLVNVQAVREFLAGHRPDVVIHSAAMRDLDPLEGNPDLAYTNNCVGTFAVVSAAREFGSALIHMSSDAVFADDRDEAYTEFDEPSMPGTVYGRTKYASELIVRRYHPRHFILRLPWIFGRTGGPEKNFLINLYAKAREGKTIVAASNQVTSMICTLDIADVVEKMIDSQYYGVYHVASPGPVSRAGFQKAALVTAGKDPALVQESTIAEMNRPAKRVHHVALTSLLLEPVYGITIAPWQERLNTIVADLRAAGYVD